MQLFRYRPINSHLRELLTEGRAWFASPRTFNDPFDCRLPFTFEPTERQFLRFLRDTRRRRGFSRAQTTERYYATKKKGPEALRQLLDSIRTSIRKGLYDDASMLCFSEHQADILMFSHYADQHRGVSVGFDAQRLAETGKLVKVEYRENYPELDFLKLRMDPAALMRALCLTKAKQWEYEREYRMIRNDQPAGYEAFHPQFIRSVTFGCECPKSGSDDVRLWCHHAKKDIQFFQVYRSETGFRLEIKNA